MPKFLRYVMFPITQYFQVWHVENQNIGRFCTQYWLFFEKKIEKLLCQRKNTFFRQCLAERRTDHYAEKT